MNQELKAMLQTLFDLIKVVEALVAKQDFVSEVLPDLYRIAADIPGIMANWNDLKPEILALNQAAADSDLVSFVISQVPGVSTNAKAQTIVSAALNLALSIGESTAALVTAIKA